MSAMYGNMIWGQDKGIVHLYKNIPEKMMCKNPNPPNGGCFYLLTCDYIFY